MFLISHRGNINGIEKNKENNPFFLDKLLKVGYSIEIDVWLIKNKLFLGHDGPQYQIELDYLKNPNFWCHSKNLEALSLMLNEGIHCFWHQEDDYTLTSKGYIWTYPNKPVCKNSVIVCKNLKETQYYANLDIAGICSDFIGALS